ncbi:hypothetical protein TNIN_222151 [Trichonephila inaurata madagascariensis]|uniref:Gustatory receptor n=1 Tax=Trichonephila inaurata madagascariensis TaxID=2747483 RepID=A0A8X6M7I5_9ARAC|nr:hypothetical protein TNIN_222151 [Trichonephila inaurata madagascariensis]
MYYQCHRLLTKYEEKLSSLKKSTVLSNFLLSYSEILKIIRESSDVASVPISLCSAIFFLQLLTNLAWILIVPESDVPIFYYSEVVFTSIMCTSATLFTPIIASKIPFRMQKIKIEVEKLYENALCHSLADDETLNVFKAILRKNSIEMTACSVISFTRGYILSLFGALFTYGLLFINIQQKDDTVQVKNCTE